MAGVFAAYDAEMSGPNVPETVFTEREGVIYVALAVNRAKCLWRETVMHDVGIDGQIEYVDPDGSATGRLVLVQVKSGISYFARSSSDTVEFRPPPAHRAYWERAPLPVILVLHDPLRSITCWTDARSQLRSGHNRVSVPLANSLDPHGVLAALASDGPLPNGVENVDQIIDLMIASRCPDGLFPVDFFDLFIHGLIELCCAVDFGIELATDVAGIHLAIDQPEFGLGIGSDVYEFLSDYVRFLVAYDLARIDYDNTRRFEEESQLVPTLIGPLTRRGLALVDRVNDLDKAEGIRVVQDKAFSGVESFEHARRIPVVRAFKSHWISGDNLSLNRDGI